MKKFPDNIHRDGFKMPDNYFEQFQEKLNNRIHADEDKRTIKTTKDAPIWSNKYAFYIAASILLLIGITFSVNHNNTTDTQITLVTDTLKTFKNSLKLDFSDLEDEDELLALFVEDEFVDEYLDDYLIEGVILQN